ncbi:GNAT family N-acetyltransferase [Thermaerobacillus caldiproteolyticus]|uniref:GNAT superfamily N-acetyltransferase n=1 Tax=Thermaerobacillus caldiproteolyticus TaxID=247480 RepID=A0A7V9Z8C4_9BACL|nr:GNAT family N-acetyltransferase [Anoxybacillus caldiproteolyticus]MBA2875927.1 GNAT superfamily N-acetyltransferase [Anoxybacillus caldiproteolyticus]
MFQIIEYIQEPFTLSTDQTKIQIDRVCEFLAQSYWAKTRGRDTIIKSIEHSLCFSLFHEQTQIGFARVITDGATFAYLCDVFVDEAYRGKGLGKWMLQCLLQHPDLIHIRRVLLATQDAHGLYRQFGFQSLQEPERFMEKLHE